MASRTTPESIQSAIDTDPDISLTPIIRTANALTTQVANEDTAGVLSSALLIEIETYLACHFYALRDPQYQAKRTADASAEFQGKTDEGLRATWWGAQAVAMDVSGYLASIAKGRRKAKVTWLGTPPSEQTAYGDRD